MTLLIEKDEDSHVEPVFNVTRSYTAAGDKHVVDKATNLSYPEMLGLVITLTAESGYGLQWLEEK